MFELGKLKKDGLETLGMTTNGVALTKKRAIKLKESGMDTANISLDTLEPMKAEFITRRPSSFHKRAIESVDNALVWGYSTILTRKIDFKSRLNHPNLRF